MTEFFAIVWMGIVARVRRFIEWMRMACRFYGRREFVLAHLGLSLHYLWSGPYRVCRAFYGSRPDLSYGETPLTTLEHIAREAELRSSDHVYELGCGTGLTALWLRLFVGCSVVGVEQVPAFVRRAKRVTRWLKITGVTYVQGDLQDVQLEEASCAYFYGTGFPDEIVMGLVDRVTAMKPGAKVITVSYPLTDYAGEGVLRVTKTLSGQFPWGRATVYVHEVTQGPDR